MKQSLVTLVLVVAACGGQPPGPKHDPRFIAGFDPKPAPAGYTRCITPAIPEVKPGEDLLVCQWIAPPSDHEVEMVDLQGEQSKYGHHVALYATATNLKVGTSRKCLDSDMLGIRFIGAIGGEGTGGGVKLPPGCVYRIPKGYALMANVHFINLSKAPIQGQAVLDLKTRAPQPNSAAVDIVTDIDTSLQVKPGLAQWDDTCVVNQELSVLMWANHMHEYGTSIYTEVIRVDGTKQMLASDPVWQPEETFNPNYKVYPTDALLEPRPGDTLHTHCEWNNTSGGTLVRSGDVRRRRLLRQGRDRNAGMRSRRVVQPVTPRPPPPLPANRLGFRGDALPLLRLQR